MIRRGLVAGMLFAVVALAAPCGAAASSRAATFHGTFTAGEGYWSTSEAPAMPLFGMPLRGVWNLNVVGQDVTANFVVFHVESPRNIEFAPKGLHAHWVQGWMNLDPVTVPFDAGGPVGRVFPALAGRVNDPAAGSYLFFHYYPEFATTIVAAMDAASGAFYYAGVPDDGFGCPPPSADVPFCFDSVKVMGSTR